MLRFIVIIFCILNAHASIGQQGGFKLLENIEHQQIDIYYNNKHLTSYCYRDSIMKPTLYPIYTLSGIPITRGFPLTPRSGERVDHPHQIGLWLNYEAVNGIDFWNNSVYRPYADRHRYGRIVHKQILEARTYGKNKALLKVVCEWVDHKQNVILEEITTYEFEVKDHDILIERTTQLFAVNSPVNFKDVKDGFLAIRVARALEHPSTKPEILLDDKLGFTIPKVDSTSVTGRYFNKEGIQGEDVWGTQSPWVSLQGKIKNKAVSITILDHPKNVGYPSYWHARVYGLFAINPLGREAFTEGKESLNFTLQKHQSTTFRYKIIIRSEKMITSEEINKFAKSFH